MPSVATNADGLRLELSAVEMAFMRIVGALSGVVVIAGAALNGVGSGRLICNGTLLQWQAPGSIATGVAVNVSGGGQFLLEDGESISKWVRVDIHETYLPVAGEAVVLFEDSFGDFGLGDVDAADALAGVVDTIQFTLNNVSPDEARGVNMWIDSSASGYAALSISQDGTNFYTPTSQDDVHALMWTSIAAGASENVWVRRTISAAHASSPELLNVINFAFTSIPA